MSDDLPTKLRAALITANISARALSFKAGLNETAVRDILNGNSKAPRLATMIKIAAALELQVEQIASEEDRLRWHDEMIKEGHTNPGDFRKALRREALGDLSSPHLKHEDKSHFLGTVLTGANLEGANLSSADLRYVDLRNSNLTDTDFTGADLRYAMLQGATITRTKFIDADLRFANLAGLDLSAAIFHRAEDDGGYPPSGA